MYLRDDIHGTGGSSDIAVGPRILQHNRWKAGMEVYGAIATARDALVLIIVDIPGQQV